MATNISGGMLPQNGRIELSFDRLLLPLSILRQTFVLNEIVGGGATTLTPTVAYDPVARVVTITPLPDQPLVMGGSYQLFITSPSSPTDMNGLRAIDGANLSPNVQLPLTFQVVAPAAPPAQPPPVDFCNDIQMPILVQYGCTLPTCHGGSAPAEGLLLQTNQGILSTAIGKVAHGSNMGPLASSEAPGLIFNEDVPIIDPGLQGPIVLDGGPPAPSSPATSVDAGGGNEDAGAPAEAGPDDASGDAGGTMDATTGVVDASADATTVASDATVAAADAATGPEADAGAADAAAIALPGDPAHSWIMYKLLMALPPPNTPTTPSVTGVYSIACDDAGDPCPTALSSDERSRLANLIPGREMPYPATVDAGTPGPGLTVDQLELMSFWIAQGAPIELSCSGH